MENEPTNDLDVLSIIIPRCCREGDEDCKHVVNRETLRKKRKNIAL